MINLYCDGACSGNPGPGGWAYLIQLEGELNPNDCFKQSGYEPNQTTNNRMEIQACIEGLSEIYSSYGTKGETIRIITDSQYVVNTMTKGWARNKNTLLWNKLDEILTELKYCGANIMWQWVKGHHVNPYNQMCDIMAVNAYRLGHGECSKIGALDGSIISVNFKHIRQFTHKRSFVDVYSFVTKDGRQFYLSTVNCNNVIDISLDHGQVNKSAEDWIDKRY